MGCCKYYCYITLEAVIKKFGIDFTQNQKGEQ